MTSPEEGRSTSRYANGDRAPYWRTVGNSCYAFSFILPASILLMTLALMGEFIDFEAENISETISKPSLGILVFGLGAILSTLVLVLNQYYVPRSGSSTESSGRTEALPGGSSIAAYVVLGPFALTYIALFGLSVLSLFAPSALGGAGPGAGQRQVTLLSINDVYRISGLDRGERGGLARVRSLRRELEADSPDLLTLLAGDFIYPSFLSRTYDGAQMIDVLNSLDGHPFAFDERFLVTFGNHEFDKGELGEAGFLAGRVAESQFTWLKSNIVFARDSTGTPLVRGDNVRDSVLTTVNGVKIGLFSLSIDTTHPEYVQAFGDTLDVARRLSEELRGKGAELVVALTHLTLEEDRSILERLGGVGPDLILGGHEHIRQQAKVGEKWVLKADADAASALVVRITLEDGKDPRIEHSYRELTGDSPTPDPDVGRLVRAWEGHHDALFCARNNEADRKDVGCLDKPVGTTTVELIAEEEKMRSCETGFGNWIADQARRAFPGADAAFIHAGSLRLNQNLDPGRILRRDIEELLQYDNDLALIEVDGATLQKVVANAVSGWPGNGRWLQISGFTFRHVWSGPGLSTADDVALLAPDGRRVEIEEGRLIRVVIPKYLLEGKQEDGYTMLRSDQIVPGSPGGIKLKPLVVDALETAGAAGIGPENEHRIIQTGAALCDAASAE